MLEKEKISIQYFDQIASKKTLICLIPLYQEEFNFNTEPNLKSRLNLIIKVDSEFQLKTDFVCKFHREREREKYREKCSLND